MVNQNYTNMNIILLHPIAVKLTLDDFLDRSKYMIKQQHFLYNYIKLQQ